MKMYGRLMLMGFMMLGLVLGITKFAAATSTANLLITDCINHRVIEVDPLTHNVLWQYGGTQGIGPNQLTTPQEATKLNNGNVLIADGGNSRVIEVQPVGISGGTIVWQYGGVVGSGTNQLNLPTDVQKLDNGNVLIADYNNSRVIEVQPIYPIGGNIIWQYNCSSQPREAERLSDGSTLITLPNNHQVIRIAGVIPSIIWSYGQFGISGTGVNQLNWPIDAVLLLDVQVFSTCKVL